MSGLGCGALWRIFALASAFRFHWLAIAATGSGCRCHVSREHVGRMIRSIDLSSLHACMFTNVLFYGSNKSSRVSRVFGRQPALPACCCLLLASFGAWRVAALSRDIGALLLRGRGPSVH